MIDVLTITMSIENESSQINDNKKPTTPVEPSRSSKPVKKVNSKRSKKSKRNTDLRKIGAVFQRVGVNLLALGLIGLVAFLVWQRFSPNQGIASSENSASSTQQSNLLATPEELEQVSGIALSKLAPPVSSLSQGIERKIDFKTIIPTRPRVEVITYTVEAGDTLFSIADKYNLKPETLLWGNFDVLQDNPHILAPKQVLNILPVNGTYYEWKSGDKLDSIASFFQVDKQDIINFPGNHIDLIDAQKGELNLETGTRLIIPGGQRDIKDWGPPAISRQNPASARYYGEGSCGQVYEGAYGAGSYVWPTSARGVSGYGYDPNVHPAVDITGAEGNAVFATDSGVVVYAGWSNYGYGYLIVVDHGNGVQSAYAHLSAVAVTCGQSVYQGGYIGAVGTTGNSTGAHLHFELAFNGVKVNPLDYIN